MNRIAVFITITLDDEGLYTAYDECGKKITSAFSMADLSFDLETFIETRRFTYAVHALH